jgi:hypothetical protein
MQVMPNTLAQFVSNARQILKPWIQYLQQFTQAPPNFTQLSATSSPFTYTAVEPGFLTIIGGTVSKITLIRGNSLIVLTGSLIVPVSISDTVIVTFSVAPSLMFIPIYGANTL